MKTDFSTRELQLLELAVANLMTDNIKASAEMPALEAVFMSDQPELTNLQGKLDKYIIQSTTN